MLTNLENPPSPSDTLFWCDFAELRALIHPDRCLSLSDFCSILERSPKARKSPEQAKVIWRDIINFVKNRGVAFGDSYPFQLDEDYDNLCLNTQQENSEHQSLYICLLLASSLRLVENTEQPKLTRFFEEFSYHIFRQLLPVGAEIKATWAQGGKDAPYQGTLFNKMQAIASDIRCTANFKERDFRPSNSGDGGIDIIAWHPMTDDRSSIPISFAQCGCSTTEWKFKQLEASPAKHGSHLPTTHPWATYYFLPIDLRESDGDWARASDIGAAIIVDRLRLLNIGKTIDQLTQKLDFPNMLQAIEKYEYGV